MSYNHSPITAASLWTRPKECAIDVAGHWGVVVSVQGHGDFLLHNGPSSGTVATPASNMSKHWSKITTLPVRGSKTIRGCMQVSMGAATNYVSNALTRYVMGATCVGTAARIGEYLLQP